MSVMRLRPISLKELVIADAFWSPRLETNRRVTLVRAYQLCERTGRLEAFRLNWRPAAWPTSRRRPETPRSERSRCTAAAAAAAVVGKR